jgi:hypothetical protein
MQYVKRSSVIPSSTVQSIYFKWVNIYFIHIVPLPNVCVYINVGFDVGSIRSSHTGFLFVDFSTLKMEVIHSSETSVPIRTTQWCIPENGNIQRDIMISMNHDRSLVDSYELALSGLSLWIHSCGSYVAFGIATELRGWNHAMLYICLLLEWCSFKMLNMKFHKHNTQEVICCFRFWRTELMKF